MERSALPILVAALALGCALEDTIDVTKPDGAGGSTQTGGSSGSANNGGGPGTGGAAGSGGQATMGGSGGVGGGAGSAGVGGADASAGSGGMGSGLDASSDVPNEVIQPDVAPEAGLPEASTCAGYALEYDGATYVSVRRLVENDFTLEAWIKAAGPSLTGAMFFEGNGLIYADVGGVADDFGTSLLNNHFSFGIGNPDTTLQSTTDVTTGAWFHVAATRSAITGVIQVFVSGVLEAQQTLANTRPLTAQAFLTLGANTIDSRYFIGWMDEVRIWNVVRSQGDILATMHQRLAGNEPGLVGYWRFDEASGTALIDSAPNNEMANLIGNAKWVPSDAPVCEPRTDAGEADVAGDVPSDRTGTTDAQVE
jgi:hypothetical protein